jgi:hypothetical protein
MGSKSQSSATTATTDSRLVVDNGGVGLTGSGNALSISTLDGGAIDSAFSFASEMFAGNNALSSRTMEGIFSLADKAFTTAKDSVATTQQAVANAAQPPALDIRLAVIGGIALVALVYFSRG